MIETLTPDQIDKLATIREKWLKIGLSTEPVDKTKAEEAIRLVYKCANLEPPKKIIWFRSPMEGALALRNLSDNHSKDTISPIYGNQDAGWLAFYDFFRSIGLDVSKLDGLIMLAENCGWCWTLDTTAILTERAIKIARDAQNRLHCEDGMAIQYSDDWGVWCWHGVRVNEEIIMNPERIALQHVLDEKNQEIRRIMMERRGWKSMLEETKAKVEHKDEFGTLYSTRELGKYLDGEDAEAKFVKVVDPSTGREYCLRVPPATTTAKEGVAWTFSVPVESYSPIKET